MADGQGQVLDELVDAIEFFYGGDDLLPKMEEALLGQRASFATHLHLQPEHAFGDYRADLVCFEDRALFPQGLTEGMQFDGLPEGAQSVGMPPDAIYTVTEIYPSHVVLDGNHPLAGLVLQLQVKVVSVREATEAEIEAQSVTEAELSILSVAPASKHLH